MSIVWYVNLSSPPLPCTNCQYVHQLSTHALTPSFLKVIAFDGDDFYSAETTEVMDDTSGIGLEVRV